MNRARRMILGAAVVLWLASTAAPAQFDASASDHPSDVRRPARMGVPPMRSIALPAGSTIRTRLERPLDARRNKAGDEVVAKVMENVKSGAEVVIPKDSRIMGLVTEVKAKDKKGQESVVGIAFDHAVLKDGSEVSLAVTIQAVAAVEASSASDMADSPLMAGANYGGSPPLAAPGAPGGMGGAETQPAGSAAPVPNMTHAARPGKLTPSSRGVIGLDDLMLGSETASSSEATRIVSQRHNVHLDSGVQVLLRVNGK